MMICESFARKCSQYDFKFCKNSVASVSSRRRINNSCAIPIQCSNITCRSSKSLLRISKQTFRSSKLLIQDSKGSNFTESDVWMVLRFLNLLNRNSEGRAFRLSEGSASSGWKLQEVAVGPSAESFEIGNDASEILFETILTDVEVLVLRCVESDSSNFESVFQNENRGLGGECRKSFRASNEFWNCDSNFMNRVTKTRSNGGERDKIKNRPFQSKGPKSGQNGRLETG